MCLPWYQLPVLQLDPIKSLSLGVQRGAMRTWKKGACRMDAVTPCSLRGPQSRLPETFLGNGATFLPMLGGAAGPGFSHTAGLVCGSSVAVTEVRGLNCRCTSPALRPEHAAPGPWFPWSLRPRVASLPVPSHPLGLPLLVELRVGSGGKVLLEREAHPFPFGVRCLLVPPCARWTLVAGCRPGVTCARLPAGD